MTIASRSTIATLVLSIVVQAPRSNFAPKNTTSTSAITTFTSGPAMAMTNSSRGSSEIRSSRASPPIGSSVTSGVAIP